MIRCLQVLFFFLGFTVEIHVSHAGVLTLPEMLQPIRFPESCEQNCALKTVAHAKYRLTLDGGKIILGSDTSVIQGQSDSVTLLSGTVLVVSTDEIHIQAPYGEFRVTPDTTALLARSFDQVEVTVFFGNIGVKPKGQSAEILIQQGCSNRLHPVGDRGHAELEIPVSPDLSVISTWATLTDRSKNVFVSDVNRFKDIRIQSAKELADLQGILANREIASAKIEQDRRQLILLKQKRESSFLKRLFMDHLLGF